MLEARRLIIPLGSTEQHGPHLPLETDSIIAAAWAERVARAIGADVAPCLVYGAAGEHQSFRGTLSIGQDVLYATIVELARSAKHHYEEVIFLSGHAGNVSSLTRAVDQLRLENHCVFGFVPILKNADAHAGFTETSMMLYLAPELVKLERAEPGNITPVSQLMDEMQRGGVQAVSPNGVLGDPEGASGERGASYMDELVATVVAKLDVTDQV